MFFFQTSLYSSNSRDNLTDDKKTEVNDSNRKINLTTPSTTPLEPRKNAWISNDTLSPKPLEKPSKEIEDEFDMFTKERVEKTVNNSKEKIESKLQRPNSIALEPAVVLNVPKANLKTVEEEDKNDVINIDNNDIKSSISETASSITQFCEDANQSVEREIKNNNNLLPKSFKPEYNELFIREDTDIEPTIKNTDRQEEMDRIQNNKISTLQTDYKKEISQHNKVNNVTKIETPTNEITKYNDVKIQESPKKINFEEIVRKPKLGENEKKSFMPENKPFLRDRSASIGTIKTPITQLIGDQNRTMLFQV